MVRFFALMLLTASNVSFSQTGGQNWSVVGARTVGEGNSKIEGAVGWPRLSVAYLRGLKPQLDVGAGVSFELGREGLVSSVFPGGKLQAFGRWCFLDGSLVSLSAAVEPSFFFNVDRFGNALFGLGIPVALRVGLAPSSAIAIGLSVELPLWIEFGFLGGLNVPILGGVGVEYFVRSDLTLFARTKMGPTLRPVTRAEFTLEAVVGVGWRF
jgi:hypothetical protein